MKKLISFIFSSFFVIVFYGQNTYLHTYHQEKDIEYQGSGNLIKCKNGDRVLPYTVGEFASSSILNILRIDSIGNILWNFTIKQESCVNYKTLENENGDLFFISIQSGTANVLKLKSTGDYVWSKNYGTNSYFVDAIMLENGEIITVGSILNKNNMNYDSYIVKIDQDGEILWEKSTSFAQNGWGSKILATEDGGCIIAGERNQDLDYNGGRFIAKLNNGGDLVWIKSFGFANSNIVKLIKTGTSNYTIIGNSSQILITNIDETGNINWSKRIPNSNGGQYLVFDAIMKNDKLILTGIYAKLGPYNMFLLNTSLTGKINWLSIFSPSNSFMVDIQANDDNGFLLSGFFEEVVNTAIEFPAIMKTDSLGQIPCLSEIDYNPPLQVVDYPVMVDSGGSLITLNNVAVLDTPVIRTDFTFTKKVICESNATQNIHNNASQLFTLYPNPASSEVSIDLTPEYQFYGSKLQIEISDALGRRVYSVCPSRYENVVVPKGILSAGYYFVSVVVQGKVLQSQKLVVVN